MKHLARGVTAQRGVLNVVTSGLQSGRLVLSHLSAPPVAALIRTENRQTHTKGKESSMSDKTGGRAFPWCGDLNDCPTINLGMTLRDYFAAKAMQALLAHPDCATDQPAEVFARAAYVAADAMLKQRGDSNGS